MIFKKLSQWWGKLQRKYTFGRVVLIESMTDLPAELNSNIYIVRRGGYDRRAVFNCPCKCGRRIDLSLVSGRGPHWSLHIKKGKATINPSVRLQNERCRSHFFVRDSKVHWV
jgi:hypothetical protein